MQSTETRSSISRTSGNTSAAVETVDPKNIRTIVLADGKHEVQNVEFLHFAIAEQHSPAYPQKLFPSLRYSEGGKMWTTPLSQVIAVSSEGSQTR